MSINSGIMDFSDFNITKKDRIYLIIVFVFAFLSTLKMTAFCLSGGILNPDISLYLISGLKYAGLDYYNVANPMDLFYTPVISFLTSLIFRLGFVDKSAIIIVTSIFGFFGYIGLYVLLRNRFNPLLSLSGVIIYGSFSVVLFNLAKGLIDLPAISVSIWVLIFAFMAIDKNPKYYLIAFPLFSIGFFVKYIVGFALPVILLYYLFNKDILNLIDLIKNDRNAFKEKIYNYLNSNEFKYIISSVSIAIVLAIIICKTFILDYGGELTFLSQTVGSFKRGNFVEDAINYHANKWMYVNDINYILFQSRRSRLIYGYFLRGIFALGLLVTIANILKNIRAVNYLNSKRIVINKYLEFALVIILILSTIGVFVGVKYLSNTLISTVCVMIAVLCICLIFKKYGIKNKNVYFDLLFLAYFAITFIFISLYLIKVPRYFLLVIPPLVYFIVWALDAITKFISNKFDDCDSFKLKLTNKSCRDNYSKIASLIPVLVILIFLITTVLYIGPMEMDNHNKAYDDVLKQGFVSDLTDACDYIKNNDADYHSKTFASYYHHERTIRWHLNVNVTALSEDDPDLDDFNDTDYLIIKYENDFKNFHLIKNCGDFNIYYHN